ncbi:hypothetical protein GTQ40_13455 [Flavobacteriaceae bacterium R38]|nr:hypothetical protein [Flavobacteriaceae bacterium R38]
MENFYFLFEDLNNWSVWDEKGYTIGFMILLFSTLIYLTIYYIILGRKGMRFSSMGRWFLFGVFNMLTIFIVTLLIEGFKVFELPSFNDFFYEIWLFTIINTLYSFVLYFILSLVFKRFSIFSKFYPVKF